MALMYCETCGYHVQPCGWCRGAGVLPRTYTYAPGGALQNVSDQPSKCPGCQGTGKFCRHPAVIDEQLQARLYKLKQRATRERAERGEYLTPEDFF